MNKKKIAGFSLIEVMIAMVVLMVLVLGAAAVVYQSGGGIQRQQNKREAVVLANHVVEIYWNMSYDNLFDYAGETIEQSQSINGVDRAVTITFSNEQTDDWGDSFLEFTVDVDHLGSNDDIVMTMRRYKYGLSKAAL